MGRQQPTTPPPPPAVQRLVIRYAKRGRMRFASHRDIARAVERGVRRAGLPVAHSAGFSPHPKISYQGGAPTGAASEAEYLEIGLTAHLDPGAVAARLDAALPDGIDVIEATDLAVAPAARLEASVWQVDLPGVQPQDAQAAVRAFLASEHAEVDRLTSSGVRRLDARAAVASLETDQRAADGELAGCAILRMVVRQMTPAVRPDDILTALGEFTALAPAAPPVVTRLWQGPLDGAAHEVELVEPSGVQPDTADVNTAYANTADANTVMAQTDTYGVTGIAESDSLGADLGLPPAAAPSVASPSAASHQTPGPQAPNPCVASAGSADAQGLVSNQATRMRAASADEAPAVKARANDQLPRGERSASADLHAREPNGRDCPNARDRATEPTARSR